jgi:hypothetical protein
MLWLTGNDPRPSPKRRWIEAAVEDAAAIHAKDKVLPDGVERVLVPVGPVLRRHLVCAQCGALRYALYAPDGQEWRCRFCHRLDHRVRHEHRDPLVLAAWLREQLGAPAGVSSPIPPCPATANARERRHYQRLVLRLMRVESRVLHRARHMVRGVELYARSKAKRRAVASDPG